jgi:hypothetical protein
MAARQHEASTRLAKCGPLCLSFRGERRLQHRPDAGIGPAMTSEGCGLQHWEEHGKIRLAERGPTPPAGHGEACRALGRRSIDGPR